MPATQNLQATLNWCLPHLGYMPLTVGGMEPALSNANMVKQTILGPPFCWRWNRGTTTLNVSNAAQDYIAALADFGFLEKVWIDTDGQTDIKEFENVNVLSATREKSRPKQIAAQEDDGAGSITFRLMPIPSVDGVVTVLYQKKAILMTSLASFWDPIPDELSYIYNWGFLALSSILSNDPRFPIFNQKFLSHLLGNQQGLSEMQRNIFLGNWLEITKAAMVAQLKTQQGVAAQQQ
jgi:hypothetical protein